MTQILPLTLPAFQPLSDESHPSGTVSTSFGQASFGVGMNGTLSVSWAGGVTLNRVAYSSAGFWLTPRSTGNLPSVEVSLSRRDFKHPSDAALSAVRAEALKLAQLLITPERLLMARVADARSTLNRAERELADAQNAHEAASEAYSNAARAAQEARC